MTQTNNEREEYENFEAWLCTLNSFSPSELRFGFLAWQAAKQSPISQNEQQEPFGYFKAEPFGWTDCAETEEGAFPVFTSPPKQAIPEQLDDIKKDAERYRWLREVSRDPDDGDVHCVITEEFLEKGKPAKMVSYLVFDEKLDTEIDKAMLNAAPTNTEVGE